MSREQTAPSVQVVDDFERILPQQQNSKWHSSLFDCFSDEESCWWGFWCGGILDIRNRAVYGLQYTVWSNLIFAILPVIVLYIVLVFPALIALLAIMGASFVAAWRSAHIRSKIRFRFGIAGNMCEDTLLHCCCKSCATCQESREAKANALPLMDFCFGEPLSDREAAHDSAIGRGIGNFADNGTMYSHFSSISKLSKFILVLSSVTALFSVFLLIILKRAQNILILLLVFLQPLAVLYFVYWRPRRKFAMLDYVIKMFACGFWLTTVQSALIEMLLQGALFFLLTPFLNAGGADAVTTDMGDDYSNSPDTTADLNHNNLLKQWMSPGSRRRDAVLWKAIAMLGGRDTATLPSQEFVMSSFFKDTPQSTFASTSAAAVISNGNSTNTHGKFPIESLRSHIVIVVIALLLMSFLVAAGVEETMKHFVVRCCAFPSPLKNPNAILVYLLAGALGFATAENIEYVFGTQSSPLPGTSVLVGEILVLAARVLLPIHLICSVLQAAYLSKSILGPSIPLAQILLPAILLHGSFDFFLFLASTLEYLYPTPSLSMEISSMVVSVALTVGGIFWACRAFGQVQAQFVAGWNQLGERDEQEEIETAVVL